MGPGALDDTQLTALAGEIRAYAPGAAGTGLVGGHTTFAPGAAGLMILRVLIYAARKEYTLESAEDETVARNVGKDGEDPFKPLPPKEVDTLWAQGEVATGGYTWVPPRFRLADSIMSRMTRANKAGEIWIPAIDTSFGYRESSSNRVITTLLRSSGEQPASGSDVQVQIVHGSQASERTDAVTLVSDYVDIITHRSAAIIACYSTAEASMSYGKSAVFAALHKHQLVTAVGAPPALMLMPRFVAALERCLRTAARKGYSTASMLAIDKRVVDAVVERCGEVKCDGNLAIEHVSEQRPALFHPAEDTLRSSALPDSQRERERERDTGKGRLSQRERELQSERDKLQSENKRLRSGDSPRQRSPNTAATNAFVSAHNKTVFGGSGKVMGGGNRTGPQICASFNKPAGCFRDTCSYRHVCDADSRGKPCGDDRHCALHH